MPTGVIANVLSVVIGGAIGAVFSRLISDRMRDRLYLVFGVSSMGLGIPSIVGMKSMSAVVLALILGMIIGTALKLGERIEKGGKLIAKALPGGENSDMSVLVSAVVIFCTSGTGIYGSIYSGMSGEHSILIAKSILDLFTAMMFATSIGWLTVLIGIPQTVIFCALFFSAKLIYPLTTPDMVADFKAVGGLIMLATGFRVAKIKEFPIADMVPALLIVWPISWAWTQWIAPFIG